jgi:hypothetical protein
MQNKIHGNETHFVHDNVGQACRPHRLSNRGVLFQLTRGDFRFN